MKPSILFLPDPSAALRVELDALGVCVVTAAQREGASEVDIVLIDPERLGQDVLALHRDFEGSHPGVPVVVIGAGLEAAIAALRAGAADYVERAAPASEIAAVAARLMSDRAIVSSLSRSLSFSHQPLEFVGRSPLAIELRGRIAGLAESDAAVLITGETGTEKELVANLLHTNGDSKAGPFVVVGCSTIPSSLAESELFGYVGGTLDEAPAAASGLLGAAHRGSLFLDEVGSLSLGIQAKLLQAIEQRRVRPLGSAQTIVTEFRVLASSSTPLADLLKRGLLREDLCRRLVAVDLSVPPLRDREHDALLLAEVFLGQASARSGKTVRSLSTAAAKALLAYRWPGNVRELKSAIEYAVTVAAFDHLSESDLPEAVQVRRSLLDQPADDPRWSAVERQHIEAVLRSVDGNRARAARLLGIDRRTLHRKLERLSIDVPPRSRPGAAVGQVK